MRIFSLFFGILAVVFAVVLLYYFTFVEVSTYIKETVCWPASSRSIPPEELGSMKDCRYKLGYKFGGKEYVQDGSFTMTLSESEAEGEKNRVGQTSGTITISVNDPEMVRTDIYGINRLRIRYTFLLGACIMYATLFYYPEWQKYFWHVTALTAITYSMTALLYANVYL